MVVMVVGLDVEGNVVEDIEQAVKVIETEHDEADNLVRETIYFKTED